MPSADHLFADRRSSAKVSAMLPPSERIIPYFFIARRMTLAPALYGVSSKLAFNRKRTP